MYTNPPFRSCIKVHDVIKTRAVLSGRESKTAPPLSVAVHDVKVRVESIRVVDEETLAYIAPPYPSIHLHCLNIMLETVMRWR